VRDATPDDVPALLDVINPAYRRVDGFIFPNGGRIDAEELRDLIDGPSRLLVAEIDGEVAGSIQLDVDGTRAHFGPLATAIAHQRRGVASTLIAAAEDIARAAGCTTMRIEAIDEVGWVPYYERRGYGVVARVPSAEWPGTETWGAARPWTMVEMEKNLR
jgi:predicted N-acetyltransferase YhbS